jgi:hypothetical protein
MIIQKTKRTGIATSRRPIGPLPLFLDPTISLAGVKLT